MKLAYFKGVGYQVPDWAEWVAQDNTGDIFCYEHQPMLRSGVGAEFWFASGGRTEYIGNPAPKPTCVKL